MGAESISERLAAILEYDRRYRGEERCSMELEARIRFRYAAATGESGLDERDLLTLASTMEGRPVDGLRDIRMSTALRLSAYLSPGRLSGVPPRGAVS